jgi:hypothetical protein
MRPKAAASFDERAPAGPRAPILSARMRVRMRKRRLRLGVEPVLQSRFGHQYDEYRAEVPAWTPILSPWRARDVDER